MNRLDKPLDEYPKEDGRRRSLWSTLPKLPIDFLDVSNTTRIGAHDQNNRRPYRPIDDAVCQHLDPLRG